MKARKCSPQDLHEALQIVNKLFEENIRFSKLSQKPGYIQFSLAASLSGPGHRVHKQFHLHRSQHACWHVHGHFFDALLSMNPSAVIYAGSLRISSSGGNWQDSQIGSDSNYQAIYFSDSCNCKGE